MCDTIGKIVTKGKKSIFAKNSDRQSKEPQIVVTIPEKDHTEETVKLTYIEVPQVKHTHAVVLSKPIWMWGAEMGVNDCSVCIGNEAVYTKEEDIKEKRLLGMDILRLALERASTAKEALHVCIELLEKYGQGGNCGYQKETYYDNSFLIMDKEELYLLETSGKKWAIKKQEKASISNFLSIEKADEFSDVGAFKKEYTKTKLLDEAKLRRYYTKKGMKKAETVSDLFQVMRTHYPWNSKLQSPCMHENSKSIYKTTASMVVTLGEKTVLWLTFSSHPCISLYKPYVFGTEGIFPVQEEGQVKESYWSEMEERQKELLNTKLPKEFYQERDRIEQKWIQQIYFDTDKEYSKIFENSLQEEKAFYEKWLTRIK